MKERLFMDRRKKWLMFSRSLPALLFLAGIFYPLAWAETEVPLAWWTLDQVEKGAVLDTAAHKTDPLTGNFRLVTGVSGSAVKFDGYTTVVTRGFKEAPKPGGAFSVSAWVALAAYPWNWCPVVSHSEDSAGYALEIGPDGDLAIKVFSGSLWRTCLARDIIPLKTWTHIAGVFDPDKGLTVFIDGREQGRLQFKGRMTPVKKADLVIGSVQQPGKPAYIHREFGTLPDWFSLDAVLDEVKILDGSCSANELIKDVTALKPASPPDIPPRVLPSSPARPGRFGAYTTNLKFYWEWDDLWRVGEHPDVVVQFEKSPVRVVFWRGTRFSPSWVTENNLWMADQSVEAWNNEEGCFEHMQDRQCRYSHVRIIENTPARIVIHWRYAPLSAYNNMWRVDPRTGWGCWIDEYYYIYPDQAGIRKYTWEKDSLGWPRQFQESIPLTSPGQLQGDVINPDYVTIANLRGEKQTFSYVKNPAPKTDKVIPDKPMIQMHNLKARNKAFIIFEPGGNMHYLRDMNIDSLSKPGVCSHWPVGQMRCDGRTQRTIDRATSFLGFPITDPVVHKEGKREWISSLYGMTDKPFDRLVPLARSWIQAPKLRVSAGSLVDRGYNFSQRAYFLDTQSPGRSAELEILAAPDSPLMNACFVFRGWGDSIPQISVAGEDMTSSGKARVGQVRTLEGTDLLIWIEKESAVPVKMELKSK
jgi:hypothetical protein